MQKPVFGAAPAEWAQLLSSPLAKWALPVVSNPNVPLAPKSSLRDVGKVPSVKNGEGHVVGMRGWTNRAEATKTALDAWARDPDLGFCLRLGHDGLYAIDCDVEDDATAQSIRRTLADALNLPEGAVPYRTRGGARWATVLRLDGAPVLSKRVVRLEGGAVEMLANGQQLVLAGTHPSGQRYAWRGGTVGEVVDCSLAQLETFLAAVAMLHGSSVECEAYKPRAKGKTFKARDVLAEWLATATDRVLGEGRNGELFLRCPWEEGHTSGTTHGTSAVYLPIGSNGYEQGGFKCLHAHCAGRTFGDLKAWAKAEGFVETTPEDYPDESERLAEVVELFPRAAAAAAEEAQPSAGLVQLRALFWDESSGSLKVTPISVKLAISLPEVCGFEFAFDTFTAGMVLRRPGDAWRAYEDDDVYEVRCRLEAAGFRPARALGKDLVRDAMRSVARDNRVDTLAAFLEETLPAWDGVPRAREFFARYCGAASSYYTEAVGEYLFGALAARALCTDARGVKADIAPVLVGRQGARKSTLAKVLALKDEWCAEIDLSLNDDTIARTMRETVVVELPELVGLRQREVTAVKAFLSRQVDEWVPKYQECATRRARRCLPIMTTNEDGFLSDATGNRRFAPVKVETIDIDAVRRDLLQLWAEGRELAARVGVGQLSRRVEELSRESLHEHREREPWEPVIAEWLEDELRKDECERFAFTTRNLLEYAVKKRAADCTRRDSVIVGRVMVALGYVQRRIMRQGVRDYVWEQDDG